MTKIEKINQWIDDEQKNLDLDITHLLSHAHALNALKVAVKELSKGCVYSGGDGTNSYEHEQALKEISDILEGK